MLRTVVIAAAAILTCVGIGLIVCGVHAPGWQALAIGVIVLIGTLFERWRYRHIEDPPGGHWQRTGEQFIDPSTGDPVEVMFDPRTGERRYVAANSREGKDPAP
ncbi:MAG TPA: hypothetical protein VJ353_13260 [Xanthobacteraceae bacterium]|nr:hypothetical protein [Xanthobacteraceae bacterium]